MALGLATRDVHSFTHARDGCQGEDIWGAWVLHCVPAPKASNGRGSTHTGGSNTGYIPTVRIRANYPNQHVARTASRDSWAVIPVKKPGGNCVEAEYRK